MTEKLSVRQKIFICFGWLLLTGYMLIGLGTAMAIAYAVGSPQTIPASSKPVLADAPSYLAQINAERAKVGVQPLVVDLSLNNTAKIKADDMTQKNYFSHDTPDGSKWIDVFNKYRPGSAYVGENLSECYLNGSATMHGWIGSPDHYRNIIDSRWTYFGSYSEIKPKDGCMVVVNHFSS